VDGDPQRIKWVLVVSINPGGIAGGSATQYFVGDFDGTRFIPDDNGAYNAPAGAVAQDFEAADYAGWTVTGDAFGAGPATGPLNGQQPVSGVEGVGFANSFHGGDGAVGTLTSPPFIAPAAHLNFKVGGGRQPRHPGEDLTTTSVDLLIDGAVVQSITGQDTEALDWASFDLRAHTGRQIQIRITDTSTTAWGHILADHFVIADAPALSSENDADWVDHGKDYYAAISWNDAPDNKRYMIGWMSNWEYANDVPTAPWRSAQSLPREVRLSEIDGDIRLIQAPVDSIQQLRRPPVVEQRNVAIRPGSHALAEQRADGAALDIEATFRPGNADRFGIKVRTGAGQETVIGYDSRTQHLELDRRRSGETQFSTGFGGIQRAPLPMRDGTVKLRILVDWSSVEVFGGQGQAVITDQIFPDPRSDGVQLFAEGGTAHLADLTLWRLSSFRN
jgi:sucrose-6-phosphate hydrolase SacC (GH32 family)